MYQNGFFSGIVERVERREYTHTNGSINTGKNIFGEKEVYGDINTTQVISYEFKLQGHSEVFFKADRHTIQIGDKMLFKAFKNQHGIFEVQACKNFTHDWMVGGSSYGKDTLNIIFGVITSLLGSFIFTFIIGFIIVLLTPKDLKIPNEYEIYADILIYACFGIMAIYSTIRSIKDNLYKRKMNKEFREMQFPKELLEKSTSN